MFESRWRCMFFTLVVLYTRIFDGDANDYDNLKKSLLTRSNFTKDGYRNRFREVKPETEETPDQFIIRLKNYLAKWLEFSVNSCGDFDALVDLIVKEQFINVCFERISCVPARERTQGHGRVNYMGSAVPDCTWAAASGKIKSTVQSKCAKQWKPTKSKLDMTQWRQRLLQC